MRRMLMLAPIMLGAFVLSSCNDSGFSGNNNKAGSKKSSRGGLSSSDDLSGGDGGSAENGFPTGSDAAETAKKLPKFGMLVNDLKCGLCHVKVRGDVASTSVVEPFWPGTKAEILGTWYAAQEFKGTESIIPGGGQGMPGGMGAVTVNATGGIKPNYTGPEVPKAFPALDYNALRVKMKGAVSQGGAKLIDKVKDGHVVLIGTAASPIVITKDVLINGDLVISGSFKGNGTIYVTGNVYIPANLIATKSPFPYPDDAASALARANQIAADLSYDGLGIVTKRSIFLGDLEKKEVGEQTNSVYNHPSTPADRKYEALGTLAVYNWFNGGKAGFDALYGKAFDCTTGATERVASIDLVDAFLMAENTIAGVSRHASYSIRGGIIADHMHIINGAQHCVGKGKASPLHGQSSDWSYVEYDYRLATGKYLIMEHVADVIGRE